MLGREKPRGQTSLPSRLGLRGHLPRLSGTAGMLGQDRTPDERWTSSLIRDARRLAPRDSRKILKLQRLTILQALPEVLL